MKELASQFIGKECLIYTLNSSDSLVKGIIKQVSDGGIIVEKKDGIEAINLDCITRIREWPRNSKGKRSRFYIDFKYSQCIIKSKDKSVGLNF